MPTVDDNRLKGNFGAAYVSARLSAYSLVRPVAADTDIGVDLYCESVYMGKPSHHFWMQVKTGKQVPELKDGTVSCSFEREQLEYWQRQPVPVFAALVPMEWPLSILPTIHIANVTEHLLQKNPALTIRSAMKWEPDDHEAVERFLYSDLPTTAARQYCQRGMVAPIDSISESYEQIIPPVPAEQYSKKISYQIEKTAAFSIISLWRREKLYSERTFRMLLANILEQFVPDWGNWEIYFALGLNNHADAKFAQAIEEYERAKKSIERDPDITLKEIWNQHLHEIATQIQKAREHSAV